jgi:hypothetical protein
LAGGLNAYGFASGDRVNFSDPLGLARECCEGLWQTVKNAAQDFVRNASDVGQLRELADAAAFIPVVGLLPAAVDEARAAESGIVITLDRLSHVINRHTVEGAQTAGRSVFAAGEDVVQLTRAAERVEPIRQAGGNFKRVVDAGRTIGIDRATGQATTLYTVITSVASHLITMFPGVP